METPASLLQRLREPQPQQPWTRFVQLYTPLLYHWARRLGLQEPPSAGGAYFSMADGSVRFFSEAIDPQILRAWSTPARGDEINASVLGPCR